MTTGQQVTFQPALAHMLTQHTIHDTAISCQLIIGRKQLAVPVAVLLLKYFVKTVGHALIRSKDTEVLAVLIELKDITDIAAKFNHILSLGLARLNWNAILAEIRETQVFQQQSAICMRVCAKTGIALRSQLSQFRDQASVFIKQLFCVVAL